jgi:hypothetical protein
MKQLEIVEINRLCARCLKRCKQSSAVKVESCPQFEEIEKNDREEEKEAGAQG